MTRLILLLCALAQADILVEKPCLWRRPITARRPYAETLTDTGSIIWHYSSGRILSRLDTTGWETYWDACPKGSK